ncbi:MAG: HlyD family efflux transporter periplasmic adaptor subunit [Cyclobacteriaceae bacterium]
MNKKPLIISGLVVIILGGAVALMAFLSSLKEPPKIRKVPEVKKYVRTEEVKYEDILTHVIAYGRVETAQSLDLLSEVSGRMYEGKVRLKEGQNFRRGDLLFQIDATEASLTLKSQKSNFLRDLAAILPDLKIDYPESFEVWQGYFSKLEIEKDLPPLPEFQSEKEKTFLATKGIYSTFYTIKSAEERLRKHWYYAPFDGSISEIVLETGAFVNSGTKIGKIMRKGYHELKVAVETKDIPWIQLGTETSIYSNETQQSWRGSVARISDYINQNTQSIDVYISIDPSGGKIYDGQFIEAAIPARIIKDGMEIPRNIIYNGNEVFVLEDSLLKVKPITIHRLMDETAVFSGLIEGEDLVAEPLINAHNNMKAYKLSEREIDLERKSPMDSKLTERQSDSQQNKR